MIDISPLIAQIKIRFAHMEKTLSNPDIFSDRQKSDQITREYQRISKLLSYYDQLIVWKEECCGNRLMLEEEDDEELCSVIEEDILDLEAKIANYEKKVLNFILPPEERDTRNTIIEIRPAAGGSEASLFVADLFRMYLKFAERQKWKADILQLSDTAVGGIKEVAFSLEGDCVFRWMRLESGVHRVQRIPTTETSGRIHTSTVTVAVLPEAKEVEITINPEDLRIDVFRSSGPGGQSVNTTDSAVRVTHVPTGVSVASQQEKSQHRNKEIAMRILRSRLFEQKQQEEMKKQAKERKSQIGTGDRCERIRTYNYPQNRITDHRFNASFYNLPEILEGGIGKVMEEILSIESQEKLKEQILKEQMGFTEKS